MISAAIALALQSVPALPPASSAHSPAPVTAPVMAPVMAPVTGPITGPAPPQSTCDEPVLMVVAGPTIDRDRMRAYGKAIADSQLYEKLGGYYVNIPMTLDTFEGEPPAGYTTLIVRFPCLENARAFWNSTIYQEEIKPLRQNPSAGDYLVTVYPEAPVREDLVGKVGDARYTGTFAADKIEQAE